MRCDGCGRLLGLRQELGCPCWLATREKSLIPERLVTRTKRARRMREKTR